MTLMMIKFVLFVKRNVLFFFVKMLGNSRILIPSWKGETLGAAIIILHKTSKRSYLFQFLSSPCPYPLHANIFVIKHKKEGKIYIINWFGTYSRLFSLCASEPSKYFAYFYYKIIHGLQAWKRHKMK